MHKLQCLATRPCATSYATHQLTIKSLSPTYISSTAASKGSSPSLSPQPSPETLLEAEKEIEKFLFGALSSFRNVKRVVWRPVETDKAWAQTTFMDAMRELTKINSLDFYMHSSRLQVPFHWFSGLQEFSIVGGAGQYQRLDLDRLAVMVAQSPQLNSISMERYGGSWAAWETPQLFRYYPKDVPPLRLRLLDLYNSPLRFDDITILHLKHLSSLRLKGIDKFYLDEVWSALIKADAWLEKITLDAVSSAFLAYLALYSGLQVLNSELDGNDDSFTTQFYAESLTNHAQSLRELHIYTHEEDLWCIGNHNLSLISQCVNLKHLSVKIIHSQIDHSADLDIVKHVIDMVVMSMPQLDTLRLRPSLSDGLWFSQEMGNFSSDLLSHYQDTIASIYTYQAPPSCARLPLLLVGSQEFLGCQSHVHDGRLMYMASPNNPPLDPEFETDSQE